MKQKTIAICGGGAGGMMCALALAEGGQKNVTIIERGDRLGRKLSATGNGQGNIANTCFGAEHYFSDNRSLTAKVLSALTCDGLISFLRRLGGLFEADAQGRVYPVSRQASSVTDLLRFALERERVKVELGACVTGIQRGKSAKGPSAYRLACSDGRQFSADNIVLATGGKAAENFGTDGTGYTLAQMMGHSVTPLYPSLVQLKTETAPIRGLKGIRVSCEAHAYVGGWEVAQKRGDVIFTDYGVSGNAIFFLSSFLTGKEETSIVLDFLPDMPLDELTEFLREKQSISARESITGTLLNNRLGHVVARRVKNVPGDTDYPVALAEQIKAYKLRVEGTLDFMSAQVTRGGVPMAEINEDLMSRKTEGLYFCGEILNVDGECGGYNLQWAFSSGMYVAKSILRKCDEGTFV